jgi:esterase
MTTETAGIDRYVTLNGLRFHYIEWPNEGAPVLVLLHGLSSHAHSWDSFARAMAGDYRVLALDQRGHGESAWADDYSMERRVEDLAAFVRELKIGRFTLLGLSLGGMCAYGYAPRYPETLERLVIVDIAPDLLSEGIQRIATGLQSPDTVDSPEEALAAARAGNPRADEQELRHRVMNNLKQLPDGRWAFRFDPALRSLDRRGPVPDPEELWATFRNISCPTLVVRGEESDLLGREAAARMAREIPDCRVVEVPGAGHSVPLDRPREFLEAVRPFLALGPKR